MASGRNLLIDMVDEADTHIVDEHVIIDEDAPIGAGPAVDADVVDEDIDPADQLPRHARRNTDGSVTLPLHFARSVHSRRDGKTRETKFEQLIMHRLTGADQRAIAAASQEMLPVVAIARSTRINQAVMNALYDKLDSADLVAAGQVLNHFLSSGPKTGR